jgi:hypothetical protein
LSPTNKTPYGILPAPLTGGPTDVCKNNGICSLADAEASENGLPDATNPKTEWDNPYVPTNTPAIGDLFDLFDFGRHTDQHGKSGR